MDAPTGFFFRPGRQGEAMEHKGRRGGLCLFNTLGRRQERFRSREAGRVKMFTCGASIYGRPHIGNYRTFLHEDVLERYLEYRGYAVERGINFTDVEDKSLAEASRRGVSLADLTDPVAARFRAECGELAIKLPAHIPRASTTVDEAVRLISLLLARGHAYYHDGDIFFDPLTVNGFGRLYGLDMARWPGNRKRFRQDTYPGQRWNLGDFILWHGRCAEGAESFCWHTELGPGRPAWNIQDPAIISKHLGPQVDICCGGIDNLCRHHDYNLAIMEAASGLRPFARYWVHIAHVLINGRKMSKSRGNILYPDDLYARGVRPAELRFFLIDGHYRRRIHFSESRLAAARERLAALQRLAAAAMAPVAAGAGGGRAAGSCITRLVRDFEAAMDDDCQVGRGVAALQRHLARLVALRHQGAFSGRDREKLARALGRIDSVLQVLLVTHVPARS